MIRQTVFMDIISLRCFQIHGLFILNATRKVSHNTILHQTYYIKRKINFRKNAVAKKHYTSKSSIMNKPI